MALAARQAAQKQEPTSAKRFGIALVGLGRSGNFHLTSIKSLPAVARLLWVVDIDESRASETAAAMACRWSSSLAGPLSDSEVDVVIVASTTDTHFSFIMDSLRAKKAVFAEKPISHTVSEVQEAVDLALEHNLPFVCGYQRRVDRNFVALKRKVEMGAIGQLRMIKSCSRDNPLPPLEYLRMSGGIFQDMLIHDFDMQDWLSGGQAPESILAVGHCYNGEVKKMKDLDTVAVIAKYASGLIAMTDTCRDSAYGYDQRVEAFGEKGMLTAKNEQENTVELATSAGHLMPPAQWSFPERYKDAYRVELVEFLDLLQAGPQSELHKTQRREMLRHPRIVKTATAAELSCKLGRQVMLSEDLDDLWRQVEGKTGEAVHVASRTVKVLHGGKHAKDACGETPRMFRKYEDSNGQEAARRMYYTMHSRQTVDFVSQQRKEWLKFDKGEFTIMDVIALLDTCEGDSVTESDLPNSIHRFQMAERVRKQWPEHDWFHLVGLLHGVGQVLALPKFAGGSKLEPWAVVGDTFPVGCAPAEECAFGLRSFEGNPDLRHQLYSSDVGMYTPQCGISNLTMSWGQDEYMYEVLKENGCIIPEHAFNMIRFRSFYPWHGGRAYMHLESPEDAVTMKWIKEFVKFDEHSEGHAIPDVAALRPYYQSLLEKYHIGGKLRW